MVLLSLARPIERYNRPVRLFTACIEDLSARFARLPASLFPRCLWLLALLPLLGCADNKEKSEASAVLRLIDAVRMAPNELKREPFERLSATPCTAADVCAARKACVEAFSHHVRSTELTSELQQSLAGDAGRRLTEEERTSLGRKLLEANLELEQGRELQPTCDQRASDLRFRRKL
jgi:hypothetical protein